jgi:toxin ParE1/3/4
MTYKIDFSTQAELDLRSIYEHIAYELYAPDSASKQFDRLEKGILGLNKMPERFRQYENEPWHSLGLRIMPVDDYCIFYIPRKTKITIIRVLYGGQDIEAQLNKHTKI